MTPAIFALLVALHRGDRHGYALIGDVEGLTGQAIRLGPGTLYRSLQRMQVEGWIEELDNLDPPENPDPLAGPDDSSHDRRAERRRRYRLTAQGIAAARAEANRLRRLVAAAEIVGLIPEHGTDEPATR